MYIYICTKFQVLGDIPFICPSEIDLLNKLCKLGTHYRDFSSFIQKYGGTLSIKPDGGWNIMDSEFAFKEHPFIQEDCTCIISVVSM